MRGGLGAGWACSTEHTPVFQRTEDKTKEFGEEFSPRKNILAEGIPLSASLVRGGGGAASTPDFSPDL